jgi:hypothetical protein
MPLKTPSTTVETKEESNGGWKKLGFEENKIKLIMTIG